MASITDLYTREESNKPQRAKIGDEWIEYLGADSDKYIEAERQVQIDAYSGKIDTKEVTVRLVAALITAWSYDEPCNEENKLELLKNSPSLCKQIDRLASKRANFTKPPKRG